AESRNLNELRKLYQHQDEVLDQLIKKFQELYLLSDADAHSTALAHDTLAPVIHKKMKDSDKPGQRAWRILQAKMADYAVNPQSTILEEDDLALVVHGASGMRMWVSKEKELIDRSKKRKEELEAARKRNRRFRRVAVVVIAILGVISSIFWQLSEREKRKVEANNKFNEGRIMLDRDPTAGLAMMVEGWHENSADSAKLTMIYETYARGIFYEIVATTDGAQLNAAAFSEDGRYAAIGTDHPDRAIRLYDLNSGKIIDTLSGPANPVSSVTFFKNHYIFAGSLDRQAYRWAPNGSEMLAFKKQEGQDSSFVKQVAVSADGGRIATVHTDLAVRLWDANSGAFTGEISLNDPVTAIAFSLTDQTLWLAFEDGNIAAYNPKNQQTARYKMGQTAIRALAFSRQGNAAAGCANGQLLTWKANNPAKVLHQTQAHQGAIGALAFSADGNFVVTGSTDLTAKVWEVATGDLVNTLKGHTAAIHSAAFSADAGFLLTASEDRTVRRWSFAYPLPLQVAGEDLGYITDLDWLPDGHVVAVTRYDKQVSWGATRFQNPVVSDLEESPTTVIASPDGKKLAIGDENGGVK
ncbi:MAG: WD40 repeat domain-containing protein, partial [Saprospiraceae bacterium]|nr:WD40 repeat domain-containing protein [Saprospiraceae bacterium]